MDFPSFNMKGAQWFIGSNANIATRFHNESIGTIPNIPAKRIGSNLPCLVTARFEQDIRFAIWVFDCDWAIPNNVEFVRRACYPNADVSRDNNIIVIKSDIASHEISPDLVL